MSPRGLDRASPTTVDPLSARLGPGLPLAPNEAAGPDAVSVIREVRAEWAASEGIGRATGSGRWLDPGPGSGLEDVPLGRSRPTESSDTRPKGQPAGDANPSASPRESKLYLSEI